jgi:hypothetical protein
MRRPKWIEIEGWAIGLLMIAGVIDALGWLPG